MSEQNGGELDGAHERNGFFASGGFDDLEAEFAQGGAEGTADRGLIIDDEDLSIHRAVAGAVG